MRGMAWITPPEAGALTTSAIDQLVDEQLVGLELRLVRVLRQHVLDRGFPAQLGRQDHHARERRRLALRGEREDRIRARLEPRFSRPNELLLPGHPYADFA